jgi:hypothetical protein
VRLGNRATLSILLTNLLAGIDEALHGSRNLRGWGTGGAPDPILLQVVGFNPSARRYAYRVNQAFGSNSQARTLYAQPFRVAVDIRFDLGPDPESRAIKSFLAPSPGEVAPLSAAQIRARLERGFDAFQFVVGQRSTLMLTPQQFDSVRAIQAEYATLRKRIYDSLAQKLAARLSGYDNEEARSEWHVAIASVQLAYADAWARLRSVLTHEQLGRLPSFVKGLVGVSRATLDLNLRKPLTDPP